MNEQQLKTKLHDTSGASVVIALVFFLICAIIGSVVLTAASVQAKATATQKELKQDEFTMTSAARFVGEDLASAKVAVVYEGTTVKSISVSGQSFAKKFWELNGISILKMHQDKNAPITYHNLSISSKTDSDYAFDNVTGSISVDSDLSITVNLTLGSRATYDMTVLVQCIPTYDVNGKLLSLEYEQPVMRKKGGDSA